MGFFNRVSNIWKSKGFKPSKEMIDYKDKYDQSVSEEREIESQLVEKKREKNQYKVRYQHECPHFELIKSKGGSSINDYYARCSYCRAEVYDHASCINYINTLIDLLNKSPKMIESYKIYLENNKASSEEMDKLFEDFQDMIGDLTHLRAEVASIKSNKFNSSLKDNILDKEEGKSNEKDQ